MKRSDSSYTSRNNKKPKLQKDVDDIWGDDPEIDEVDRCINLATQLCSQTEQGSPVNKSLSYDDFKHKPNMCSSTQLLVSAQMASTSKITSKQKSQIHNGFTTAKTDSTVDDTITTKEKLSHCVEKLQSLEGEYNKLAETKNGEITILRSQLKQTQKAVDNEKMEKLKYIQEQQQTFHSKCNLLNKELDSYKCELKLKNLEIVNLREKITEFKKAYNSSLNNESICTQTILRNKIVETKKTESKIVQTENNNSFRPPYLVTYPLKDLIPEEIFENCTKSHFSNKNKSFVGLTDNLQTFDKEQICINNLHKEIIKLKEYTKEKLNSEEVVNFIKKIIKITKKHLLLTLKILSATNNPHIGEDKTENASIGLEQCNIYHSNCIFTATPWNDVERGIEIRRFIGILSIISLNNNFLFNYLTTPTQLGNLNNSEEHQMQVDEKLEFEFLKILLDIVTLIRTLKESYQYCGLLSAILNLLRNLTNRGNISPDCIEIIFQIFKQIILSHPVQPALKYVCEFLVNAMIYPLFVSKLCTGISRVTQTSSKETISNFSQDSCTFRVLAKDLEFCLINDEMACDIIQFLKNCLNCNITWMFQEEELRCECVVLMYSLGIYILHNTVKEYEKSERILDKTKEQVYHLILLNGRIFLHVLTKRIPNLIMKCSQLYSQYYKIINFINTKVPEVNCLDKAHETAIENLVSQFNFDEQKQINIDSSIELIFNNNFTS